MPSPNQWRPPWGGASRAAGGLPDGAQCAGDPRDGVRHGTRHPIEEESYRIIAGALDRPGLEPGARAVVERVAHATADLDLARGMVVDEAAVEAGVSAIRTGKPVVTDVEMVRHGITGATAHCYLAEAPADPAPWPSRAAAGMALAAERSRSGMVVVVGCAPTALQAVLDLAARGKIVPSLVIGTPVGFVGAAESKQAARESRLLTITNVGERGGSAVAAAVFNALARMARQETEP